MPTSKAEFQYLAVQRIAEAKALLDADLYDGAFYLAGYCIECALKAIYCTRFGGDELPDKEAVNKGYTHNLANLLQLCGLESELLPVGSARQRNWTVALTWTETSRYGRRTKQEAEDLIRAVDDSIDGIRTWLQSKW